MRFLHLPLTLFFLGFLPSFAQQKLSLTACIRAAKFHHGNYLQAQNAKTLETAKREFTQRDFLPQAEVYANPTLSMGRSVDPTTFQFATRGFVNNILGLSLSQTVYAGGRRGLALEMQEMQEKMAETQVEKQEALLTVQVIQQYFQVLIAQAQVRHAETQYQLLQQITPTNEDTLGRLQFQAQISSAEWTLVKAQQELKIQKITLGHLIGSSQPQTLTLEDYDSQPQVLELAVATDDRLFQQYYAWHPDYRYSQWKQKWQSLQMADIRASRLPSISLNGGVNLPYSSLYQQVSESRLVRMDTVPVFFQGAIRPALSPAFENQFRTIPLISQWGQLANASLGIQIRIPIMAGNSYRLRWQQAKHDLQLAQIQAQQIKNDLIKESALAQSQVESTMAQYKASQSAFDVWNAYYQNALPVYQRGEMSQKEFQDIIFQFLQTDIQLTRARYEYHLWQQLKPFYESGKWTQRKTTAFR